MSLPAFVPAISDDIRTVIVDKIAQIQMKHRVKVLFAVESGSRAWGFPSPDSDYDVQFVYAHTVDWYLSIKPGRDVIELPIDDVLDINGWDIRKALGLLLKPNPVLLEWLSSPIRYIWDDAVCSALIEFSQKTAHRSACLHHYLHLGEQQWNRHVSGSDEVSYKKYFYILRPALAIRWIRHHGDAAPPMNLQALMAGLDIDKTTVTEIEHLLLLKSRTKEIGAGQRLPSVDALIQGELEWGRNSEHFPARPDLAMEADALFRTIIKDVPND